MTNNEFQKLNLTITLKDIVKASTIDKFKENLTKILSENNIIDMDFNDPVRLDSITLYNDRETFLEYTQL